MKFIKANSKDTIGSGFSGYLVTKYEQLIEQLGIPHDCTQEGPWRSGDGKVRVEWAFKSIGKKPTVITIYDYKEAIPVDDVTLWHVGVKGDGHAVERFFKEKSLSTRGEPLDRGLLF